MENLTDNEKEKVLLKRIEEDKHKEQDLFSLILLIQKDNTILLDFIKELLPRIEQPCNTCDCDSKETCNLIKGDLLKNKINEYIAKRYRK